MMTTENLRGQVAEAFAQAEAEEKAAAPPARNEAYKPDPRVHLILVRRGAQVDVAALRAAFPASCIVFVTRTSNGGDVEFGPAVPFGEWE